MSVILFWHIHAKKEPRGRQETILSMYSTEKNYIPDICLGFQHSECL